MTRIYFLATAIVVLIVASVTASFAAIGQIKNVRGEVFLLRNNVKLVAKAGDLVELADTIVTGATGRFGATMIDNSRLSAGPNSRIEIKRFTFDPTTHDGEFVTDVQRGTLTGVSGHIAKRSPDAMKIKTPTTIIGVRGTTFAVKVEG